ncbi:MAG: short-chain dehydrogenase [Pseudomonadales bacterium]|nr:short-chain dehydrogenase [Pseudomonadales bacterium]
MHWSIDSIPNLNHKTILITGANSGIGFEAARVFAAKGARLILACRNQQKGQAAINRILQESPRAQLTLMSLDLSSLDSVKAFSAAVTEQFDHIDVLVNNAGVMAPPYSKTKDGFESQFGTNHLGHFALTARLLPLLEKAEAGRVVVVSSVAHRLGHIRFKDLNWENRYSRWQAYGQSKLANLMFAKELQRRLQARGSRVIAVAVHPGYSNTNLQQYMPVNRLLNSLFSQSQEKGALPTLCAATQPDLSGGEYIGPNGFLEMQGKPDLAYSTPRSNDKTIARRLWDVSEKMTGESFLSVA